ncbi:MAG: Ig-like domain-containing protein, partial [Limisphaerales bacterium]
AVHSITVQNFSFSPSTLTINAGDKVIWTWTGQDHNVTSTSNPQAWTASATASSPFSFTNTFNSAGTFPYECTIHAVSFNMKGTITVNAAANVPPTVSITNPVAGAVFAAPANVTVQASASDSDGTVTNVQFLDGSTVLANVSAAPFSATANNLEAGGYTLSAIASDNLGAMATNSVTISVVTPVALNLGAIARTASTNFQFSYAANAGLKYVVQRSTNLISGNWISLVTNIASSNPVIFVDDHATNNPGFYRVGRLPNP